MFKKLVLLGAIFSFTVVIGSGDDEGFSFFKNSGLASIGPCRTMEAVENQIRRKVANTIFEIYDVLNRKGRFPEIKQPELMQSAGNIIQEEFIVPFSWEVIQALSSTEGMEIRHVLPKKGIPLSQCVTHVREYPNELVIECTSAATMVKFSVLSAFYSDIRVNSIKSFLERQSLDFVSAPYFKKLETICSLYLFDELVQIDDISDVQLGDFLYIKGHPKCLGAVSLDYSRGENLYCVGFRGANAMFMGFGSLFAEGPKTAEQIQQSLAEAYVQRSTDQESAADAFREVKNQSFYLRKFGIEKIKKALTPPKRT